MQKQKFEVHLTVDQLDNHQDKEMMFRALCQQLDAKVLEIVLLRGQCPKQMMLSKILHASNLTQVLEIVQTWVDIFSRQKIHIARIKIEVPFSESSNMSHLVPVYYEWHALIPYENLDALKQLCHEYQVHLSYNALKNHENERFITLREYDKSSIFQQRMNDLKDQLHVQHRKILKEQSEMCIYDNRPSLDQGWLTQ